MYTGPPTLAPKSLRWNFDFGRPSLLFSQLLALKLCSGNSRTAAPCNSLVPDFVVTLMLPPLARLSSALNAAVSMRNSSTESTGGRQAVHVPDVVAPAHFDGQAVDADVPVVLLAAADLKVVPGAFAVAALHLRHHHHDAECIAHAAADAGDGERNVGDELLLHCRRHFGRLGFQRRRLRGDYHALGGLSYFERDVDTDVVVAREIDSGTGESLESADGYADFIRSYLQIRYYVVAGPELTV